METLPTHSVQTATIPVVSFSASDTETTSASESLKLTEASDTTKKNTASYAPSEKRRKRNTPSVTSAKSDLTSQAEDRLALNIMVKRLMPCGARVEEVDGRVHIILPSFISYVHANDQIRFVSRVKYKEDEQ